MKYKRAISVEKESPREVVLVFRLCRKTMSMYANVVHKSNSNNVHAHTHWPYIQNESRCVITVDGCLNFGAFQFRFKDILKYPKSIVFITTHLICCINFCENYTFSLNCCISSRNRCKFVITFH